MINIIKSFFKNRRLKSLYPPELFDQLQKYPEFVSLIPVWCATSEFGGVIHRFFDTSPFSPSGRYLALLHLPSEERLPAPGDVAEVVLVDLERGKQWVVANTRGWDTQVGAQVQWGANDTQLFFNDIDTKTWRAFGVKLDPLSGRRTELDGTVYMVSPDGNWIASPCLLRIGITQAGYGVVVPPSKIPLNRGASTEDGVFVTNAVTGECRLLVSTYDIVEATNLLSSNDKYTEGDFYGFHVKWNPQGTRLMFVLRWISRHGNRKPRSNLISMKSDGSDIQLVIPDSLWSKGGHHPNWCPDGETILMNLNLNGDGLRFIKVRYDGSECGIMCSSIGSGHPSLHPNGRHILTDAYPFEQVAFGDGTVPIRLIDVQTGKEKNLVRVSVNPPFSGPKNELRVDPHPVWDRSFRRIAFNACVDNSRRVFIADLSNILR